MPPTPGLLWVNSRITTPETLSDADFNTWYNSVHIPDVVATSMVNSAARYKSIDPASKNPYLALYPVSDVTWLGGDEFHSIPVTSDYFPGPSHACFEFAQFDTRYYEFVHGYEKPGARAGPANLVISAALTPALGTDADFDAWYMEEHYGTLAECKGYVRTRRYKLREALRAENEPPVYLALHEFESESLPMEELAKTSETPWAKKVMGTLAGSEVGVYKLLESWGDTKATF